VQRYDYFF